MSEIILHNSDCMEALEGMDDNQFDLAIVDPPYGINIAGSINSVPDGMQFEPKDWDKERPPPDYFSEVQRVSKNQIIWGGNYFSDLLPPSKGWVVWDKHNGASLFADCELAFSSFDRPVRRKKIRWVGSAALQSTGANKIHPCQKPVNLYEWILHTYAKPGQTILDTHLGSGSIALACHNLGFDLTGYEIDKDYFQAATARLAQHKKQGLLF